MNWAKKRARTALLLVLGLGCLSACRPAVESGATPPKRFIGAWLSHRDASGFDAEAIATQIEEIQRVGFEWVALAPEPQIPNPFAPTIVADPHDADLVQTIRLLRAQGLKVCLCPRLESPTFFRAKDPLWRGDIAMSSAADWTRFHEALATVIQHYAELAAAEDVELFSLGLEYRQSTSRFPAQWRQIIRQVREVYEGPITYSANWYEEYHEIEFWDALDYIGIGAYFPIAQEEAAGRAAMRAAWARQQRKLEAWASGQGRPLLYSEIGYPGVRDAGLRPWQWGQADEPIDHVHQAACYQAFFDACPATETFHGFFIWRYEAHAQARLAYDYSPQGRPATGAIESGLGAWKKR